MTDIKDFEKQTINNMTQEYRKTTSYPECEKLLLYLHSLFIITGQVNEMFCNSFVEEAIKLLKNAIFLYKDGLFDCAFYSIKEASEVINSIVYLIMDSKMKKEWESKNYFPVDKKLREKLEKMSADYKEIKNAIPEYFKKHEDLIKKANKIIHKQGFDTFYRARQPYANTYGFNKEKEFELFIELEKYTIGLLLIIFIIIDPLSLVLTDPNVTYKINFNPMTEPINICYFEDYLNLDNIIPKIKGTSFYKNIVSAFDNYEEMSPAVFNIVRTEYFDINALDEISKQLHLISPLERLMFFILKNGIKVSNFYSCGGLLWYITSIECNRRTLSFNNHEFNIYSQSQNKFNQKRDNVYISVLKLYDDFLYLEHNEILTKEEIDILKNLEQKFLTLYDNFIQC